MNELKLINVCKNFGKKEVLKDISLNIRSHQVIGLVGENGCGKTVLMKIMIGLMKASKGQVIYNDKLLKKDMDYLPSVGFIIENPCFLNELNGYENLKLLADIRKKISDKEILAWLEKVGLKDINYKVDDYSLGMKQRLALAQALMEDEQVLILDEPTNSLDEKSVELFHQLIKEEKDKGKIIIISSHNKYDIEKLSDEVYRIRQGNLYHEKKTL